MAKKEDLTLQEVLKKIKKEYGDEVVKVCRRTRC